MKSKILLVNDDQELRDLLKSSQNKEYEYILLDNSAEGMMYLENNSGQIDLILMDMMKTVENQFEVVKCTQNHYMYKNIPILISASPEQKKRD